MGAGLPAWSDPMGTGGRGQCLQRAGGAGQEACSLGHSVALKWQRYVTEGDPTLE